MGCSRIWIFPGVESPKTALYGGAPLEAVFRHTPGQLFAPAHNLDPTRSTLSLILRDLRRVGVDLAIGPLHEDKLAAVGKKLRRPALVRLHVRHLAAETTAATEPRSCAGGRVRNFGLGLG